MNLKYVSTIEKPKQFDITEDRRIHALAFSPTGQRLAVVHDTLILHIYDPKQDFELRDKFKLKPLNKDNRKFQVKNIQFNSDGSRLAVAQTDGIIFVYDLGLNWDDKKTICHKIETTSSVTALVWPRDDLFFYWGK